MKTETWLVRGFIDYYLEFVTANLSKMIDISRYLEISSDISRYIAIYLDISRYIGDIFADISVYFFDIWKKLAQYIANISTIYQDISLKIRYIAIFWYISWYFCILIFAIISKFDISRNIYRYILIYCRNLICFVISFFAIYR